MSWTFYLSLLASFVVAVCIGWIDTRATWDDTGVTVGLIVVTSFSLGFAMPKYSWLWALAIGGTITVMNVIGSGNFGAVVSIAFALIGCYTGAGVRKVVGEKKR